MRRSSLELPGGETHLHSENVHHMNIAGTQHAVAYRILY